MWSTWNRLQVRAYVGVDKVVIIGPDQQRVEHPRQRFGGRSVDYRHFLPELAKKPQALRQVADELLRDLGPPYDALWRQLVDSRGPKEAARQLAKVLAVVVERGDASVRPLVAAALASNEPVLLALRPAVAPTPTTTVPASLAGIEIGCSDISEYDRLLGGGAA